MAATSILTALRSCNSETKTKTQQSLLNVQALLSDKILKDAKMCLQILTLAGSDDMESCCLHMAETLPENLTGHMCKSEQASPDTTMAKSPESTYRQDDCTLEMSDGVSSTVGSSSFHNQKSHLTSTPSREQTPEFASAVDVFSDFNSSVLQAVLSPNDSYNSILVTWEVLSSLLLLLPPSTIILWFLSTKFRALFQPVWIILDYLKMMILQKWTSGPIIWPWYWAFQKTIWTLFIFVNSSPVAMDIFILLSTDTLIYL